MEVMEDGNLMDKVLILIQRDMEYYNNKQTVLQEIICPGIVGGRLDFPRSASFAAVKLVLWWEEEFIAAYRRGSGFMQECSGESGKSLTTSGGCGGIVKASDPAKFIALITKSSDELLEHLHILTQEALDHADLTVLTGTIGAAALLKNCLWCYIQTTTETAQAEGELLQKSQKKYQDMGEALAERLLDLHCRLLSLYILQDAESLDWENVKPFCESERGSYIIQMWWLYMQGTKEDLWNTVPPKMAQRVFSGMLNESLTILAVRYSQAMPSEKRSPLYSADVSNLLLCISKLLPSICANANEFIGVNLNIQNKMLRDIHSKCQELLVCLLFRGSPLDILFKVFRKGLDKVDVFKPKRGGPSPWIVLTMNDLFADQNSNTAVVLELLVLLPQPQPNWETLLKVLCMQNCKVFSLIFKVAMNFYKLQNENQAFLINQKAKCGGFLCSGDGTCKGVDTSSAFLTVEHYYNIIYSITYTILLIGNEADFSRVLLKEIIKHDDWYQCFERRQVWNQKRPAWYSAILDLAKPILQPIIETTISAVKTGASMYQACSIVLACLVQIWECVNPSLFKIAGQLQEMLPTTVIPIGKSALLQLLISALYTELLNKSAGEINDESDQNSDQAIALTVGEALCSIDEDNKHTDQIEELLLQAKECMEFDLSSEGCERAEKNLQVLEALASDLLFSEQGKRSIKILYHFIKNNSDWLLNELNDQSQETFPMPNIANKSPDKLLHTMFCIGNKTFDQLLVGKWVPNWLDMFGMQMGLSTDRVYSQISSRWEFSDTNFVNHPDGHIVTYINTEFKQSYVQNE